MHINHDTYYRDRLTEKDLCYDFPGDEILIDGLHAMQMHFWFHNVPVDIPVVRVMNAAHFLAAYMFATTCSGDQSEYDGLAYGSIGHDKQLTLVTMMVLAAMLRRTEGFRARNCRNVILADRDPDFEEGISLYERFLHSAEKRFAEEDFLIDTHAQIQKLVTQNEQLTAENKALKIKYQNMENQQNRQYNNCVFYNAPVYNTTNTTNNYYPQPEQPKQKQTAPQTEEVAFEEVRTDFSLLTELCRRENKVSSVEAELSAACKGTAVELWRVIRINEALGYLSANRLSTAKVYRAFTDYFGDLPYTERNFRDARDKA